MYKIYFYKDRKGRQPVLDYIKKLEKKNDKDSHIKIQKIHDYINVLKEYGLRAGEPYIKHITGDIWELRPLRDRFFFVYWIGEDFIFLHHFMKKTQKTPKREIDQAIRNYNQILENGEII